MARSRPRATAQQAEADAPVFRRKMDEPGAPKVGRKAKDAQLPKESIPGDNTVLANMGDHVAAYRVGLYVKHETTDEALARLGLAFKTTAQRADAVLKALAMPKEEHEREYARLGSSELPETVGITWSMNGTAWPFPNIKVKSSYAHWELVELDQVPTRVKAAAEECETNMASAFNSDGTVKPLADRVGG